MSKPGKPQVFCYFRGYICTANADGSVPINSLVACKVEEVDVAFDALIRQANTYPQLVEALRETIAECEFHGAGNSTTANKARALLREVGEL